MQVLLDPAEARQMRRVARLQGMTLSEWVRQTLRAACRRLPGSSAAQKTSRLRASLGHAFPVSDIETMLSEIAQGHGDAPGP